MDPGKGKNVQGGMNGKTGRAGVVHDRAERNRLLPSSGAGLSEETAEGADP